MKLRSNPEISATQNIFNRRRALIFGALLGVCAVQNSSLSQAAAAGPDAGAEAGVLMEPQLPDAYLACPSDMVNVNDEFCIDRYEASIFETDQGRLTSPYYTPNRWKAKLSHNYWSIYYGTKGTTLGKNTPPPSLEPWQLETEYSVEARSLPNTIPNGYLNARVAEAACKNARKRLCDVVEWRKACQSQDRTNYPYGNQYVYGKCNYERSSHPAQLLQGSVAEYNLLDPRLNMIDYRGEPYLRRTGEVSTCKSRWGDDSVYDMVGNLDEWALDSSGGKYVIVGGAYSRGRTERGCQARIDSHSPNYEDYSLGTRCCKDVQ